MTALRGASTERMLEQNDKNVTEELDGDGSELVDTDWEGNDGTALDGTDGNNGTQVVGLEGLDGEDGAEDSALEGLDAAEDSGSDGMEGEDAAAEDSGLDGLDGLDGKDGAQDGIDGFLDGIDGNDGALDSGMDGIDGSDSTQDSGWDGLDGLDSGLDGQDGYFDDDTLLDGQDGYFDDDVVGNLDDKDLGALVNKAPSGDGFEKYKDDDDKVAAYDDDDTAKQDNSSPHIPDQPYTGGSQTKDTNTITGRQSEDFFTQGDSDGSSMSYGFIFLAVVLFAMYFWTKRSSKPSREGYRALPTAGRRKNN